MRYIELNRRFGFRPGFALGLCGCAAAIILTFVAPAIAQPSMTVDEWAKRSLVKIKCKQDQKVGSGFAWQESTQIVTALHVVAGGRPALPCDGDRQRDP